MRGSEKEVEIEISGQAEKRCITDRETLDYQVESLGIHSALINIGGISGSYGSGLKFRSSVQELPKEQQKDILYKFIKFKKFVNVFVLSSCTLISVRVI